MRKAWPSLVRGAQPSLADAETVVTRANDGGTGAPAARWGGAPKFALPSLRLVTLGLHLAFVYF